MAAKTNESIAPTGVYTNTAVAGNGAVANQNTDTPTNLVEVAAGGPDGTRLTKLTGLPRNTTVASRVMLFRSKDGGATKRIIGTAVISAYSWSTTSDPAANQVINWNLSDTSPMFLENASDRLYVGFGVTQGSDNFVFEAVGGKYGTV